jgi:hypothetical protein
MTPSPRARAALRRAALLLDATANPDGPGLLLRGREHQPLLRSDLEDAQVVSALIRLARLAESVAEALRDCPDARVRRSAAVLAARAHPIRVALDD